MSKIKRKFEFIGVDDMALAATLVSKGYRIDECIHSPKHKKHTYLFYSKDNIYEEIELFKNFEATVNPVMFLHSMSEIHKDYHGGCNDN